MGFDAVVVGAGPNGLAAAITLALAGRSVLVVEAAGEPGGGARSAPLTLPGFVHDTGSAIHPLAAASPLFGSLPLGDHGLEWIHSPAAVAHPLDGDRAVLLEGTVEHTAAGLGTDGPGYRRMLRPLVDHFEDLLSHILGPLVRLPRHPVVLSRFGLRAIAPATRAARWFTGDEARALFAGNAAHAVLPLERPFTASFGLLMAGLGHTTGWPFPRGGAARLTAALVSYAATLGVVFEYGRRINTLSDLPPAAITMLDLVPRRVVEVAGTRLPGGYRRRLSRYAYGPGAFKVDYALDGPVPWRSAGVARAATVHVGGTLDEIAASERTVSSGEHPERPFVLAAQHTLFDPERAPAGKHTLWAYCHVPNGSTVDMTDRLERQIERFAPGFRDLILARHVTTPADLEQANANNIGGDIAGGSHGGLQLFLRPVPRIHPYSTPVNGLYLCSSSTPPGGGVHGMCGFHAARAALD